MAIQQTEKPFRFWTEGTVAHSVKFGSAHDFRYYIRDSWTVIGGGLTVSQKRWADEWADHLAELETSVGRAVVDVFEAICLGILARNCG